jgi:hypothetical protein
MGARLLERIGRALRFSPEGRRVRVWVDGWPGEEDSKVVEATLRSVDDRGAMLEFDVPPVLNGHEVSVARAMPRERGFGLDALWFSFIAVDAASTDTGEPLGRWAIRLASRR